MRTYVVNLIGTTWEGFTGSYSYTFNDLPTDIQIRQGAGDFQDVTDYQTVETTTEGDFYASMTTRKIIDKWQKEESAVLFAEMNAA